MEMKELKDFQMDDDQVDNQNELRRYNFRFVNNRNPDTLKTMEMDCFDDSDYLDE